MRNKIPNPNPQTSDVRRLSSEDLTQLRNCQLIITFQRSILAGLENEFARIIAEGQGVDLENEVWELDLDKGEIRRANDAQQ